MYWGCLALLSVLSPSETLGCAQTRSPESGRALSTLGLEATVRLQVKGIRFFFHPALGG